MARHAAARQRVIAENLANADTPGYGARDVPDFAETLTSSFDVRATRPGHATGANERATPPPETQALPTAPNGNSVVVEDQSLRAVETVGAPASGSPSAIYSKAARRPAHQHWPRALRGAAMFDLHQVHERERLQRDARPERPPPSGRRRERRQCRHAGVSPQTGGVRDRRSMARHRCHAPCSTGPVTLLPQADVRESTTSPGTSAWRMVEGIALVIPTSITLIETR